MRKQTAPELKADIQPWLTEQCSRLMYGKCSTLRCLKRGGYTGPESDYDAAIARATCEPYELSQIVLARDVEVDVRVAAEEAAAEIISSIRERNKVSDSSIRLPLTSHVAAIITKHLGSAEKPDNVIARSDLEAIVIRCTDGSKDFDWLPTIKQLAEHALKSLTPSAEKPAWDSMETAPRDSSWVLGLMRNGRQTVVRWANGGWLDDNRLWRDPQHWMKLPDSPSAAANESQMRAEKPACDVDFESGNRLIRTCTLPRGHAGFHYDRTTQREDEEEESAEKPACGCVEKVNVADCPTCKHRGRVLNDVCQQAVGKDCSDPYGEICGCECPNGWAR